MIIPEIMPGELALGYFFRFRHLNGYKTDEIAIKALRKRLETANEKTTPLPVLLARALAMSLQQFCRFHTLLPFARAVTGYLPELPHGDPTEMRPVACNGLGVTHKVNESIKVCVCCVSEDIDYWGYAYYRREHQLPGVSFCHKHSILLSETSRLLNLNSENISPIKSLTKSLIDTNDTKNEIINRYFTIVESWSMAERPIPVLNIVNVLQPRARALGIRWSITGNKPLLSDLAVQVCPEWWLQTIVPTINYKKPNQRLSSIDGVLVQQEKAFRSSTYALALCILFDNAEEALNASYKCISDKSRIISKSLKQRIKFYEGKELTQIFIKHRGNSEFVARELGVDSYRLRKMMKKNGLPPLAGHSHNVLQAFKDFHNGMSLMEACAINHGNPIKLEALLRSSSKKLADALMLFKYEGSNQLSTTSKTVLPAVQQQGNFTEVIIATSQK